MATGRFDSSDAPGKYPVLDGRIAYAEFLRCLPRSKQGRLVHFLGSLLGKYCIRNCLIVYGKVPASRFLPKHSPCDCNHSTAQDPDDSLPLNFSGVSRGLVFTGVIQPALKTSSGGSVTVANWVEYFAGGSVLSLLGAVFLAFRKMGRESAIASMQSISATVLQGTGSFLKRQSKV